MSIRFLVAFLVAWSVGVLRALAVAWKRLAASRSAGFSSKRRTLQIESLEERQLLATNILDLNLMNPAGSSLGVDFTIQVANGQYAALDLAATGLYGYDCGNVVLTNKATGATTTLANQINETTKGVVYVQSGTYTLTVASAASGVGNAAAKIKIDLNDSAVNKGGANGAGTALIRLQDAATLQKQVLAGTAPVSAWANYYSQNKATIEAVYGVGALDCDVNTRWAPVLDVNSDGKFDNTDRAIAQQAVTVSTTNPVVSTIASATVTPTGTTQQANSWSLSATTPLAVAAGTQTFVIGRIATDPTSGVVWTCTANNGSFADAVYTIAADGTVSVTFSKLPTTSGSLSFTIKGTAKDNSIVLNKTETVNFTVTRQNPSLTLGSTSVTTTESASTNVSFTVTDRDGEKLPTDSTWYTATHSVAIDFANSTLCQASRDSLNAMTPAQIQSLFSIDKSTRKLTFTPNAALTFLQEGDKLKLNVTVTATHNATGKNESKVAAWEVSGVGVVTTYTAQTSSITLDENKLNAEILLGKLSTTALAATTWTVTPSSAGCTMRVDSSGNVYVTFTSLPAVASWDTLECGKPVNVTIGYTVKDSHGGASSTKSLTVTVTPSHDSLALAVKVADEERSWNIDDEKIDIVFAPEYTINATPSRTGDAFTYAVSKIADAAGNDLTTKWAAVFTVDAKTGEITIDRDAAKLLFRHGEAVDLTVYVVAKCNKCGTESNAVPITLTLHRDAFFIDNKSLDSTTTESAPLTIDVLSHWTHGTSSTTEDRSDWTITFTDTANVAGGVLSVYENSVLIGTAEIIDNKIVFTPSAAMASLCRGESRTVTIAYTVSDEHGDHTHTSDPASFTIKITGVHTNIVLSVTDSIVEFDFALNGPGTTGDATVTPVYSVENNTNGETISYSIDEVKINGEAVVAIPAWIVIDPASGAVTIDRASDFWKTVTTGKTLEITVTVKATCDDCPGDENSSTIDLTLNITRINSFSLADVIVDAILETKTTDTEVDLNTALTDGIGSRTNWITWGSATLDSVTIAGTNWADDLDLDDCFTFDAATGKLKFKPNSKFDFLAENETATVTFTVTATDAAYGVTHYVTVTFTVTGETTLVFMPSADNTFTLDVDGLNTPFTIGTAKTDTGEIVVSAQLGDDDTFADFVAAVDEDGNVTITFTKLPPSGENTVIFTITANDGDTNPSIEHEVTVNVTRRVPTVTVDLTAAATETKDTSVEFTVTDPNLEQDDEETDWYTVSVPTVTLATSSEVTQKMFDDAGVPIADLFKIADGKLTFAPSGALDFLALGEKLVFDVSFTVTDNATKLATETKVTFTITGETTLVFTADEDNETIALTVDELNKPFTIGTAATDTGTLDVSAKLGDGEFTDFTATVDEDGKVTITFTKLPPSNANIIFTITAKDKDGNVLATIVPDYTVAVTVTRYAPTVTVDANATATETSGTFVEFTVADPNKEKLVGIDWYTVSTPTITLNSGDATGVDLDKLFTIENGKLKFTPKGALDFLALGQELVLNVTFTVTDKATGLESESASVTFTVNGETTLVFTADADNKTIALTVDELNKPFTIGTATTDTGTIDVSAKINGSTFNDFTFDTDTGVITITFTKLPPSGENKVVFTITAKDDDDAVLATKEYSVTVNVERLVPTVNVVDENAGTTETQNGSVVFTVTDPNGEHEDDETDWYTVSEPTVSLVNVSDEMQALLAANGVTVESLAAMFVVKEDNASITFTPTDALKFLKLGESLVLDVAFTVTHKDYDLLTTTAKVTFTITGETTFDYTPADDDTTIDLDVTKLGTEFTIGNAKTDADEIVVTATIGGGVFTDFTYEVDSDGNVKITFTKLLTTGDNTIVFTITANDGSETPLSFEHTITVTVTRLAPTVSVTGTPSANETDDPTELTITVTDTNKEQTTDDWYSISDKPTVSVNESSEVTQQMLGDAKVDINSLFAIANGKLTFAPNGALDFLALGEKLVFDVTFTVKDTATGLETETKVTFTVTGETTLVFTKSTDTIALDVIGITAETEFKVGTAVTDTGTLDVTAVLGDGTTFDEFIAVVDKDGNVIIMFGSLPPSGANTIVFTITANDGSDVLATTSHTVTVNVTRLAPTVTVNATATGTETLGTNAAFTVDDPNLEQTGNAWYSVSDPTVTLAASSAVTQTALTSAGVTIADLFTIVNGEIVFTPNAALKCLAFGEQLVLDVSFTVTALDTDGVTKLETTKSVAFTITGETTLVYTKDATNGTAIAIDISAITNSTEFTIGNAKTDSGTLGVSASANGGTFTGFIAAVDASGNVTIKFTSLPPSGANSVVFTITANDGSTNPFVTHTVTVNVTRLAPTVAVSPTASGTETTGTDVSFTVADPNLENLIGNSWYTVSTTPTVSVNTTLTSQAVQDALAASGVNIASLFTIDKATGKLTFTPTAALQFLALNDRLVLDVSFTVTDTATALSTTKSVAFTVNGEATVPVAGTSLTLRTANLPVVVGVDTLIGQNWQTQLGTPVDRGSSFTVSEMSLTIDGTTYTATPVYITSGTKAGNWDATFKDGANNTIGVFSYVASTNNLRFTPAKAFFADLAKSDTRALTIGFKITGDNGTAEVNAASATFNIIGISEVPSIVVGSTSLTTNESTSAETTVTITDPNNLGGTLTTTTTVTSVSTGLSTASQTKFTALGDISSFIKLENGKLTFAPNSKFDFLCVGESFTLSVKIDVLDSATVLSATKTVTFTVNGVASKPTANATIAGFFTSVTAGQTATFNGLYAALGTDVDAGTKFFVSQINVNIAGTNYTVAAATAAGDWTAELKDGTKTVGTFTYTGDTLTFTPDTEFFATLKKDSEQSLTIAFTIKSDNDETATITPSATFDVVGISLPPTIVVGNASLTTNESTGDSTTVTVSDPNLRNGTLETTFAVTGAGLTGASQTELAKLNLKSFFTLDTTNGTLTFAPDSKFDFLCYDETLTLSVEIVVKDNMTKLSAKETVTFTVTGVKSAPTANATLTKFFDDVTVGDESVTFAKFYESLGTNVDAGTKFAVSGITVDGTQCTMTPGTDDGDWTAIASEGTFRYDAANDELSFTPNETFFAKLAKGLPQTVSVSFQITSTNGMSAANVTTASFKVIGISVVPKIEVVGDTSLETNESTDALTTVTVTDPNNRTDTLKPDYSVAVNGPLGQATQDALASLTLKDLFTFTGGADGVYTLAFVPGTLDFIAENVVFSVTISVTDSVTEMSAEDVVVKFTITPSAPTLETPHDDQEFLSDVAIEFGDVLANWTHDNVTESGKKDTGWNVTLADGGKVYAMIGGVSTEIGTAEFVDGKITFTPSEAITGLKCGEELSFAILYTVTDSRGIASEQETIFVTVTGAHDKDIEVTLEEESQDSWTFHTNDPALGTTTVFTATPEYAISGNEVGAYYSLGDVTATGTTINDWSRIILVDRETGAVTIDREAFAELGIGDDVELTVHVLATCRGDDAKIGDVELTFSISKFDSFAVTGGSGLTGAETSSGIAFDFANDGITDKANRADTTWAEFDVTFDSISGNIDSETDWAKILDKCFSIEKGVFTFAPNGKFDFLAVNQSATLTFTVTVTDAAYDVEHTATITITIAGEVSAPTVNENVDLGVVTYGTPKTWTDIGKTLGETVDQGGSFVLHAIRINGGNFVEFDVNGVATIKNVGTFTYIGDSLSFTPDAKFAEISAGDDFENLAIQFQLRNIADTDNSKLSDDESLVIVVKGKNTAPVGIAGMYAESVVAGGTITFAASEIATDINRRDKLEFVSVKGLAFNGTQSITLAAERLKLSLNAKGEVVIDTSGWIGVLDAYSEDAEGNPTGSVNSYTDVTVKFVIKDDHSGTTGSFIVTFFIKGPLATAGEDGSGGTESQSAARLSMPQGDATTQLSVTSGESFVDANIASDQYRQYLDGATTDAIFSSGDVFAGDEQWFIAKPRSIGSGLQKHESDAVFAGDFDLLEVKL